MKPYSDDLRLRIIETIQANQLSQAAIARRFSVGKSFVEKLWQRFRTTGSYQAKTEYRRGPARALKNDEAVLLELVGKQPDATLEELCEAVARATNKPRVTSATMCVELQRLKLPLKKSRFTLAKEKLNGFSTAESNIERR
jgi:transposase